MSALLLQSIVNGLITGVVYGLIGAGLNIVFGVLRVVNFAHGEFVILGAYGAWLLAQTFGISPFLAIPLIFVLFFAVSFGLYFALIPPLAASDDPEISSLLMMFGISISLGALMLLVFGADARSLPLEIEPVFLTFGLVTVPTVRLLALAVALGVVAALSFFLYRTHSGKALRAIVMNREAVQIVGIKIGQLSALAFGIGIGLAGITGILTALVFPSFSPFAGADYTLIGFVVIVLGGLGHPIGALLGAILFVVTEQVSSLYVNPSLASIFGFSTMIVTIFVRPNGLLGRTALR